MFKFYYLSCYIQSQTLDKPAVNYTRSIIPLYIKHDDKASGEKAV